MLSRRRIGLGALALISLLVSPALVVYEFLLSVALLAAVPIARHVRSDPEVGGTARAVGAALLAGPVAYAVAWLLA